MAAPELMLATDTELPKGEAAKTLTASGLWVAEAKLDGIRACVQVNGFDVVITNRRGATVTHRYPEVVIAMSGLQISAALDGEIVALGENGMPDFARIHRRDAQDRPEKAAVLARTMPALFMAFDVLSVNGMDVRSLTYERRRRRLEGLSPALLVNPAMDDGQELWDFACEHKLEGVVCKRKDSRYQAGRSPHWVKIKRTSRISALVTGCQPGRGHCADTFGALELALLREPSTFVAIGSVGTGFTDADRRLIWRRLQERDMPIIVDVEYLEVSPNGKLRNPSFQGCRRDLTPFDCTVGQLN